MRKRYSQGNRMDFEEDINPMGGLSNLADAMLVLAVGIMLALVMNWHINIAGGYTTEVEKGAMQEVDSGELSNAISGGEAGESSDLEERGTVYVDKNTGTMYLVEKNE